MFFRQKITKKSENGENRKIQAPPSRLPLGMLGITMTAFDPGELENRMGIGFGATIPEYSTI